MSQKLLGTDDCSPQVRFFSLIAKTLTMNHGILLDTVVLDKWDKQLVVVTKSRAFFQLIPGKNDGVLHKWALMSKKLQWISMTLSAILVQQHLRMWKSTTVTPKRVSGL